MTLIPRKVAGHAEPRKRCKLLSRYQTASTRHVRNSTRSSACQPFAMLHIAWLQVHAKRFGYSAVLAAIFVLATCSRVISQHEGVSSANVARSTVHGGLVNGTNAGSSDGFTTVTVDGRTKTIGATSAGADGLNTSSIDILSSVDPPVINPPQSDPTAGVPAPPVVSPPGAISPPGSAGKVS